MEETELSVDNTIPVVLCSTVWSLFARLRKSPEQYSPTAKYNSRNEIVILLF